MTRLLLPGIQSSPIGVYPRKTKLHLHEKTFTEMYVVALLIVAKPRNHPDAHQILMDKNKQTKKTKHCGIATQ